jgi:3-oxoadipate enol-lactonase
VLLLHGLGWDHRLWTATQARLAGRYRTIAPDLRGHGGTPATPGGWSVHDLAADCRRLLDQLRVERCVVVGFSLGGMVAAALAQSVPERVAGLLLAGCALHVTPEQTAATEAMLARARTLGAEAFAREQAAAIWHPAWRAAHPEEVAAFVARRAAMDQAALALAFRCTRGIDLRPGLARLTMPCLVVAADQDPFVAPAEATTLAAALPNAALVVIEGCGHMLTIEQPERFAALLDGLLARVWPDRAEGAA